MLQKACCVVSVTVVNNSSVSIIPVAGLASDSHYQVHVQSLSVSGVANSKPMSFKTDHEVYHQQMWQMPLIISVLIIFVLLVTVALVKIRR